MKNNSMTVTMVVFLAMMAGVACAQPPGEMPPGRAGHVERGGPPMPPPEIAQENRELLEQVMVSRLSRDLNLTDEQSILLMRRVGEMGEVQRRLRRERMAIMRELRQVLQQQEDEAALKGLMTRLKAVNEESARSEQMMRDSFEELELNVWQQAGLELFLADFENQMRRLIQQAREGRGRLEGPGPDGAMGRPRRTGPPTDRPEQQRPRMRPRMQEGPPPPPESSPE